MTTYGLSLCSADVFQILDALESRADSWESTARHLNGMVENGDDFRIPEECSSADEAERITVHFRDIIATINGQVEKQEATVGAAPVE